MRIFWTFVLLQVGVALGGILAIGALTAAGASDGTAIAVAVAVSAIVVGVTTWRVKVKEERRVAEMPPEEARRLAARRVRIGLVGTVIGIVFFGVVAIRAQTPQAFILIALYVAFAGSLIRRLRSGGA